MNPPPALACPTCEKPLTAPQQDTFRCEEEHHYTVIGLALATNIAALRALWMAIRALEDDAVGLEYMAAHYGDVYGMSADARLAEAAAARASAKLLRTQAKRAQARLDALPAAPSAVREAGGEAGRGG